MKTITLQQYHVCERDKSIFYKKINCKHWTVTEDSCSRFCNLKKIQCTDSICYKCEEREPINNVIPQENKRTNPIVQEMRNRFPQHNVYKPAPMPAEENEKEKSFADKAKTYAKAETSQMVQGKVSKKVFEKRKAICMACEYRVETAKNNKDEIGWCKGGCGCTVGNPRAALSQKLYMPTLSCPKGRFGPEKGEGFNISDVVDSVKGVITSVKNLFEKDK
jgi:hypothetical protein